MSTFVIKKNNTSPVLQATLKDAFGNVINLNGASVRFHMKELGESTLKIDTQAEIVEPATSGIVRYSWRSGDTSSAGIFKAEFEVTYYDNNVETFPNEDFITILIQSGLD